MSEETTVQPPEYVIEEARSSRSKCKTCGRSINKDTLRIGFLIEGPFGTGYLWHHLRCAARRQLDRVEEAYEAEAWNAAKTPPRKVTPIEELRSLQEEAQQRKQNRQELPYAERAPSGRSKCKNCEELIEKGSFRVILAREVQFGRQIRSSPINIHPGCVVHELQTEDCGTEVEGFADALRANSKLEASDIEAVLKEIGDLPDF